jgi:hypothetical protein
MGKKRKYVFIPVKVCQLNQNKNPIIAKKINSTLYYSTLAARDKICLRKSVPIIIG